MRNRPFFTGYFIYVYALFLALMTVFGILVYRLTAETVEQQTANKCAGIATAVATLIEQDAAGYRRFLETLDRSDAYYVRTTEALQEIFRGNADNIRFLYTEKKVSDTEMMFVLDAEPEDSPAFSPPGLRDELTPTRRDAYAYQSLVKGGFVTTGYGTLLSAYAPIHDPATGALLGLVGVDVSIDQYQGIMRYFRILIIASIGMMILMVAVAIAFSSGKIERLITLDNLTGVYNRGFFMRSLKRQVKHAKKRGEPLLVVMTDLDHFKRVNDDYGHPFGDKTLVSTAKALRSALRETDCLARYGGEEFAGYFPGLTPKHTPCVLERIRGAVRANVIHNDERNEDVRITISIGAAYLRPNQSVAEVLEEADKALYRAKESRDAIVVSSQETPVPVDPALPER